MGTVIEGAGPSEWSVIEKHLACIHSIAGDFWGCCQWTAFSFSGIVGVVYAFCGEG